MRNMSIQARPHGHKLTIEKNREAANLDRSKSVAFDLSQTELAELASMALISLGADEDLVADLIDQAKDSAADRETEQEQRYDG